MNPLAHLDPIGFICLVVAGFGWAKPVPVNPLNFKNSQKGMAITAAAGPISNFILAYLVLIVYKLFYYLVGGAAAIMTNTALWAVGQILAAVAISQTPELWWYLPVLVISGVVTGAFTGLAAQFLLFRLEKTHGYLFSKK